MKELSEWEGLTVAWSATLKKARAQQAIIDDKMSSFLRGTGRIPTLPALAKVEQYWELHEIARQATNKFIAQKINATHRDGRVGPERRKSVRDT